MAVTLSYRTSLNASETVPATVPGADSTSTVTHNGLQATTTLDSSTTPAITKIADFVLTLTAGAATIDMTALTGTFGSVTFSGLKLQAVKIQNTGTNPFTITKGASNGLGFGTGGSTFTWVIPAKSTVNTDFQFLCPEGTPDVDGTHKTWDVTGTGTDTLNIQLIAG